jgi:maleylpyruvate isomerase
MPTLTLHTYWRSSASHRVRIALGAKGLSYDPVFVNLLEGKQREPEYRRQNPMGFLPCLVIDGTPYVESVAIVELLEELYPEPPLLPRDATDRARVRALVQIVNAGIQPLQNLVVLEQLGDAVDRGAWLRNNIARGLTAFDTLVARYEDQTGRRGPFSFGDSLSMADVFLLPQLYAARRYQVDVEAYPHVARAEAAASGLPFVRAAHPDAQPDAAP